MKRIILNLAVTLDGFIEGPNGEIDWCIMDDDMDFDSFIDNIDTMFYGRVSYESWGNFHPGENITPAEKSMWQNIHTKNKFVFTHQQMQDGNATFITSDIATHVAEIKKQDGKDIWLYGGAKLIKTFIDLQLIDVYKLSVHPIALGKGKPLFENLHTQIGLKLTGTRVFKSGVVELSYEPGVNKAF